MILRLVISLALATLASAKTASCVVYTTPGCAYCTRAKTFLSARDVAYEEYDVSVDRSKLEEMIDAAGRSTLPQIFVGGEHVGAALNPVIGGGRADAGDASAVAARLQRSMLE